MDTELMRASEVINAIGLAGVLFYFLSPTIVVLLVIYNIKRFRGKNKINKQKTGDTIDNSKTTEINEDVLDNVNLDNIDYTKFDSLSLEFDKEGKALNNK